MKENCIVTFVSLDQERYRKGFERLKQSIEKVGFDGDFLAFHDESELEGCPLHSEVPYAFKAYAIKKAIDLGYKTILWVDAPVWAQDNLENVFAHIKRHGYLFFDNIGFSIGDYTSDNCLLTHNMTRVEAFKTKMIMACCMGIDVRNNQAHDFFERYYNAANDGSYIGNWNNNNLTESTDLRCKGHRHDQSVASILIAQMGLKILTGHQTYFTYYQHPGMMPVADSVCLFSQGF
jgi:hypothetical protein